MTEDDKLPEDLERVLRALGLAAPPTLPRQPERKEYPKPWKPSYPGEDPPF